MAVIQTLQNGTIRMVEDNQVVWSILPRQTESGRMAAEIAIGQPGQVGFQHYDLYERSLVSLINELQKAWPNGNHR